MSAAAPPTSSSAMPAKKSSSTTTSRKGNKPSAKEVKTLLSDPRFNRTFQLPANPSQGRPKPFQVSYADFGYHRDAGGVRSDEGEEEQVLLFFGPLMSSRMHNIAKDGLAKRYKIRFVNAERPGIGKTDSVPAEKMLEVWREAVAALLNHLDIKHVSVGCHSGGTVYGLDFAVHYPQYLHPSRPYIAIAAPWVHTSQSGMLLLSLASSLPRALVSNVDKMATFVHSTLGPALGASSAISGSVPWPQAWTQAKRGGRDGPDVDFEDGIRDRVAEHVFSESVSGLGQETRLLLRNGFAQKDGWSDWGGDFDVLAPRLAEAVQRVSAPGAKLKFDVFFAEKDHMIGDAGNKSTKWFESCWSGVDGIEFTGETVKGADHDGVWDLRWDVMERVFKTMTQDGSRDDR